MALIQRRGSKTWTFYCKVNGKPWSRSTGTTDRRKAEEIAKNLERLAQLHRERPNECLRLSKAIVKEVKRVETDINPHRAMRVSYALENILKAVGDVPLERINHKMVETYQRKRLAVAAKSTVNEELGCLLRLLRRNGFNVPRPEPKSGKVIEQREFTMEELKRFFDACPERLRLYYVLLLVTGARPAELIPSKRSKHIALRKAEVDLEARMVTIRSAKSRGDKRGKIRVLPLPEELVNPLREHLKARSSEFVFDPLPNGPRDFNTIIGDAKVPKFDSLGRRVTAHSFRHTYATLMSQAVGHNPYVLKEILGHEKISTTERYCHPTAPPIGPAVHRLFGWEE